MGLDRRLKWVCLVLFLGAGASWGLHLHLQGGVPFADARGTLNSVRANLAASFQVADKDTSKLVKTVEMKWTGKEHPGREELLKQVAFADEVLYRYYIPERAGPVVQVYAAYSKTGEDRKHHPEICMREAAGKPEDMNFRKIIPLDAEGKQSVQRFRFLTGTSAHTIIYYWHCTFPMKVEEGQTGLQALHGRLNSRAPSLTVQVSTDASGEDLDLLERTFLPALQSALSESFLPAGTTVGCDRLPIVLLRY